MYCFMKHCCAHLKTSVQTLIKILHEPEVPFRACIYGFSKEVEKVLLELSKRSVSISILCGQIDSEVDDLMNVFGQRVEDAILVENALSVFIIQKRD